MNKKEINEGKTYFCIACEGEGRGIKTKYKHTCGIMQEEYCKQCMSKEDENGCDCPCHKVQEKSVVELKKELGIDDYGLELFQRYCKVYQDYSKKAEIKGMDMVIGHLAVITRNAILEYQKETDDKWRGKLMDLVEEITDKNRKFVTQPAKYKGSDANVWREGVNYGLDQATNIIKELLV